MTWCKVGLHNWKYTQAEYSSAQAELLALPTKPATRCCADCGKVQYEDRVCLGLRPPEYYSVYRNEYYGDWPKKR